MMKQDDWIKQLSDKLADHQATVPDDLWAGIEVRLDGGAPQRRPALSWRRWLAAAAAVLLLAGGSLVLWEKASYRDESEAESLQEVDGTSRIHTKGQTLCVKKAGAPQLVAQNHTKGQALCVSCVKEPQEESKAEELQAEEPKTEEPKTEEPKTEEPKTAYTMSTEKPVAQSVPRPQETPADGLALCGQLS